MKVLDLRCDNGHVFEGWFGSEEDFLAQNGRDMVEGPVCGSHQVTRMLSAPRLNLGAREPAEAVAPRVPAEPAQPPAGDARQHQALWLAAVQHVLRHTEDVGERFAEEARRIHYGEVPHRGIRGQATPEQREALQDEGIEVMPLPLPAALKGPVQ